MSYIVHEPGRGENSPSALHSDRHGEAIHQVETRAPCSRLGGGDFTCEKSLCQAPSRPFIPADKLALCLAKTGAWKRTPEQLERLTLTRACTGDCLLPAVCLKP